MLHLTNREALTVLCSAIKHTGSGWSTEEVRGETRDPHETHFSSALAAS